MSGSDPHAGPHGVTSWGSCSPKPRTVWAEPGTLHFSQLPGVLVPLADLALSRGSAQGHVGGVGIARSRTWLRDSGLFVLDLPEPLSSPLKWGRWPVMRLAWG